MERYIVKKEHPIRNIILFIIIMIFIYFFIIWVFSPHSNNTQSLVKTDISASDYNVETTNDLDEVIITIRPHTNIESMNIQVTLLDKYGGQIIDRSQSKNDLITNNNYEFRFKFEVDYLLITNSYHYEITGSKYI